MSRTLENGGNNNVVHINYATHMKDAKQSLRNELPWCMVIYSPTNSLLLIKNAICISMANFKKNVAKNTSRKVEMCVLFSCEKT